MSYIDFNVDLIQLEDEESLHAWQAPQAPHGLYLGHEVNDIWSAVYSTVGAVTYGGASINSVKGRGYPRNTNPRVYVLLGPAIRIEGRTRAISWWNATFNILIFYDDPNIDTSTDVAAYIAGILMDALEADLQLGGLTETLLCQKVTPQVYPGFERSNAQINVVARFEHTHFISALSTGTGIIPTNTGTWWNNVVTQTASAVQAAGVASYYESDRGLRDVHPLVYIICRELSTRPLTTQKTISRLQIDCETFTQESDITAGEVSALQYAGRLIDELVDDRRLGDTVDLVEGAALIPKVVGYEESCVVARLEGTTVR